MIELACDVLVVGGGAAGSRAALEAKRCHPELRVVLAVAGRHGKTGSTQLIASESLGINAPFNFAGDGDSPDVYYQDMLATGGGLNDPALCRIIADESCARIQDLTSLGMAFDCKAGVPDSNQALRLHQGALFDLRRFDRGGDAAGLGQGQRRSRRGGPRARPPARPLAERRSSRSRRSRPEGTTRKSASAPEQPCWRPAARAGFSATT